MTSSSHRNSGTTPNHAFRTPNINGLLEALELMQLARDLARQQYLRKNPGASSGDIENWIEQWVSRPRSHPLRRE